MGSLGVLYLKIEHASNSTNGIDGAFNSLYSKSYSIVLEILLGREQLYGVLSSYHRS